MSSLGKPSIETVLTARENLARALMRDIASVAEAFAKNVNISPSVQELVKSVQGVVDADWRVIEPEVYHWYFGLLGLLENRKTTNAREQLESFGNAISWPLWQASRRANIQVCVPVKAESGRVKIPQIDESLVASAPAAIEVDNGRAMINGELVDLAGLASDSRLSLGGVGFLQAGFAIRDVVAAELDSGRTGAGGRFWLSLIDPVEERGHFEVLSKKIASALSLCHEVYPSLHAEVAGAVEFYSLLNGSIFVGASDFRLPGVTLLRMDSNWSVVAFLDHIVHEASHQVLFFNTELAPLVENPNEEVPSPIRGTCRPLLGSVHATFVFQRLVDLFSVALSSSNLSDTTVREVEARLHRHLLGLQSGLKIVREYAALTEVGKLWIAEAEEEFCNILNSVTPDPRLAAQVGGDYDSFEASSAHKLEGGGVEPAT